MPNCGSFETEQVVVSQGAFGGASEMSRCGQTADKHWSNAAASPRRSIEAGEREDAGAGT